MNAYAKEAVEDEIKDGENNATERVCLEEMRCGIARKVELLHVDGGEHGLCATRGDAREYCHANSVYADNANQDANAVQENCRDGNKIRNVAAEKCKEQGEWGMC